MLAVLLVALGIMFLCRARVRGRLDDRSGLLLGVLSVLAGGVLLVLRLRETLRRRRSRRRRGRLSRSATLRRVKLTETVEISGHLMDSGVLARVLDDVLEYGGDYTIDRLDVGREHDDESYARIAVGADDDETLQRILMRVQIHGVNQVDPGDADLQPAARDGVFPDDFYSTTNLRDASSGWTGSGSRSSSPRWTAAWSSAGGRGARRPGVRRAGRRRRSSAAPPASGSCCPRSRSGADEAFEFMSSAVSSEKPQALLVRQIAERMREVKAARRARSSGSAARRSSTPARRPAMVALVEAGYVDVLFAGNALATHDIESALYGTSLGVDLSRGSGVPHGHEHHIRAINRIRRPARSPRPSSRACSPAASCTRWSRRGKKFVLVGSVRDDGPLPDVYTDVIEGQRAMRAELPGVGFAIMVATMLHSIATGNILPASVPLVSVDINPATVTKLADRGSAQAIGIVTDIGLFLEQLARELVPDFHS